MTTILDTDTLGVIISFLDIVEDRDIYKSLVVIHKLTDNESSKILDYWLVNSKVKCKTNKYGNKHWYTNNILHRENDKPAVEQADGKKKWYTNGQRHRDADRPAIEYADGDKYWYVNDKLHREVDRPAVEYADGSKYWYVNGQLHRDNDLPAIEYASGRKEWWINDKFIRYIRR